MNHLLDNLAEGIGRSRLAARRAAKSPGRRAALKTILGFAAAGSAYALYQGTRVGIADRVAFTDLGLDKLPMNELMLQRSSLHDIVPVELIEYADIDLNLQDSDESLLFVDKETGEDLDAMLAALLDAQQKQVLPPVIEPEAAIAAVAAAPEPAPLLIPEPISRPQAEFPAISLAPTPGRRNGLSIPDHRTLPDLVPKTESRAQLAAAKSSSRSSVEGGSSSRSSVPGSSQTVTVADAQEKWVTIQSTHTGERLRAKFVSRGRYDNGALAELNHLLRDHRNDKVREIDRGIFDQVHEIAVRSRGHDRSVVHLVSGYRSPETNNMLRAKSSGVAKNSYHVRGRAMDMFVDGAKIADVHVSALKASAGGVGYYPSSNFVHIDTGPVRNWPSQYKPLANKYRA